MRYRQAALLLLLLLRLQIACYFQAEAHHARHLTGLGQKFHFAHTEVLE
ncbi:MAG: hypothetical protein RJB19_448, partial [Pseudomonadota bacterium]